MHISNITITNFKCFGSRFDLELNAGLNILVGDNEAGKSTIIEAINLALSGIINGRYFGLELTQGLFNLDVVNEYLKSIKDGGEASSLPEIRIEIFMDGFEDESLAARLRGSGNSTKRKASGIAFWCKFDESHKDYYETLVKSSEIQSLPVECYGFGWSSFARDDSIGTRSIPIKSALIDSTRHRSTNGSDLYIAKIIKDYLNDAENIDIARAHRNMQDEFGKDEAIKRINSKLKQAVKVSDKSIHIAVGFSRRNGWDTTLTTYLDNIPFQFVGMGEQSLFKTKLALAHEKSVEANVLLIEEPENHLSHTNLHKLLGDIGSHGKQTILSTHSAFVANKLGLDKVIMLNDRRHVRLTSLGQDSDTAKFFKKLPGYDTLRLVLSEKSILVEGPSDELIVQRAYKDKYGRPPIEDKIDVISAGTSSPRFLEIAAKLNKKVAVIIDNDGSLQAVKEKFQSYLLPKWKNRIEIFFDECIKEGSLKNPDGSKFNYNTLEPNMLNANDLELMNAVLGRAHTEDKLLLYMQKHKTDCALCIFEFEAKELSIHFPQYILNAIKFIHE